VQPADDAAERLIEELVVAAEQVRDWLVTTTHDQDDAQTRHVDGE
jgi:hypothetical protein